MREQSDANKTPSLSLYNNNTNPLYNYNYNYNNNNSKSAHPYKISINSFIANSRLIKSLPTSSYLINPAQVPDILITCPSHTPIAAVFLTMAYHIKFPRYLQAKLAEIKQAGFILLLLEAEGEVERVGQVQMAVLQACKEMGNMGYWKVLPCFGVDDARARLFDLCAQFTAKNQE